MMRPTDLVRGTRGRSIYVIPTLFTSANILCGFDAAVASLKGYHALDSGSVEAMRYFNHAAIAIGWAVLFDSLDGTIARMAKATSDFGIELDSIADVVSFGIAPAILLYAWGFGSVVPSLDIDLGKLSWAVSFMFLVCGAYRLARFNVQAHRAVPTSKKEKRHFVGMPIPAAAGLIAAIVHFAPGPIAAVPPRNLRVWGEVVTLEPGMWSIALLVLIVVLSLLMVSTIRYPSFKDLPFTNISPRRTLLYVCLLVSAIYLYSRWVLLVVASGYALHGVSAKLVQALRWRHKGAPAVEPAAKTSI